MTNKNSKNPAAAAQFINYRVNSPDVWKVMSAAPGTPVNSEARAALPSSPASDKVNAYLDIAGQHAGALFCFRAVKQAGLEPAKKKSKIF